MAYLIGKLTAQDFTNYTRWDDWTTEADLYYPATSAGTNKPPDLSGAPYPTIVLVPASLSYTSSYTWFSDLMVPLGYVVAMVQVDTTMTDFQCFADGFIDGITYLQEKNADAASRLYTMIDESNIGIFGHSSGGDGSLLAASQDSRIKCVLPACADYTDQTPESQDVYDACPLITVPVQMQLGSADLLVSYAACHAYYPQIKCVKEFVDVTDAGHMSYTNTFQGYPENDFIDKYVSNWFAYWLKNDKTKYSYLFGPLAQADLTNGDLTYLEYNTHIIYDEGRRCLLNGEIGWNSNTIKCMLASNAYTPALTTQQHLNQVDTYRFTGTTDATLANKTCTGGIADADNIVFASVAASGSYNVNYLIIYEGTGYNTNSHLIACLDSGVGLPVRPNGSSITVTWDNTTNRIFRL